MQPTRVQQQQHQTVRRGKGPLTTKASQHAAIKTTPRGWRGKHQHPTRITTITTITIALNQAYDTALKYVTAPTTTYCNPPRNARDRSVLTPLHNVASTPVEQPATRRIIVLPLFIYVPVSFCSKKTKKQAIYIAIWPLSTPAPPSF